MRDAVDAERYGNATFRRVGRCHDRESVRIGRRVSNRLVPEVAGEIAAHQRPLDRIAVFDLYRKLPRQSDSSNLEFPAFSTYLEQLRRFGERS